MLYIILIIISLGLNIWELNLLYKVIQSNNADINEIKSTKTSKRKHTKLAKTSFSSPLDPYEQYKDKTSKLYEPRRPSGGIRIEVNKD